MKRFQSVLCTLVLALSLSSTVLAGTTSNQSATAGGIIHGSNASGIIHGSNANGILISDVKADGILISDVFTWGNITSILVNSFGIVLGD